MWLCYIYKLNLFVENITFNMGLVTLLFLKRECFVQYSIDKSKNTPGPGSNLLQPLAGWVKVLYIVTFFIRNQNYWWCICSLTLPLGIYIWFAWEIQWPHALLPGLSGTGSSAGRSHCKCCVLDQDNLLQRQFTSHRLVSRNWVLARVSSWFPVVTLAIRQNEIGLVN